MVVLAAYGALKARFWREAIRFGGCSDGCWVCTSVLLTATLCKDGYVYIYCKHMSYAE
jgi:hypothetical protein